MSTEYVNPPAGGYPEMIDVSVDGEKKKLPVGPPFVELGGTGLKRSTGVIDEEFLPALRGTKGVKVFTGDVPERRHHRCAAVHHREAAA